KNPLLLIGETGIAKTSIVHHFLQKLSPDDYVILNLNFSSRTTSLDVQLDMTAALEKRTKSTYGPPRGKNMLCFIDDLNKPQVDQYGTQQPLAMLKHLFEQGGFYDFGKEIIWKNIKDSG
ncbi:Dynein heavy chain 10, partial [Gryllus bimaculatus]